jgi:hypothetical protein
VGDGAETPESYLRRGTFYGVDGTEEAIDFFGIVVAFERDEAVADDLEMFFCFRLEEFQNLIGNIVVVGQRVEIRARGCCFGGFLGILG